MLTIDEAIREYIEDTKAGKSAGTARTYSYTIKSFIRFLDGQDILPDDDIGTLTIEHFIEFPGWLGKNYQKKSTVIGYTTNALCFLDWLAIKNILTPGFRDTARLKRSIAAVRRKREIKLPKTPMPGDIEKMITTVYEMDTGSPQKERDIAMIEFLASSGCRVGEIIKLKIGDIDLERRSALVTGKGSKQRYVFFNPVTARALARYWSIRSSDKLSDPAFSRHDKRIGKGGIKPMSSARGIQHAIDLIADKAGLVDKNFHPHKFRHGFAVKVLQETSNLALVQDLLGHTDPKSTRVYAKITFDDLAQAHRRVFI